MGFISINHKQHYSGAYITACWSLCQGNIRLTLDGSSTHCYHLLQLHEKWALTLNMCLHKEGEAIKVTPHFYLGAKKAEHYSLAARKWENSDIVTCWPDLPVIAGTVFLSHILDKNKGLSSRNPVKGRKERRRRRRKMSQEQGFVSILYTLEWCLEWKHPGRDKVGCHVWLSSWHRLLRVVALAVQRAESPGVAPILLNSPFKQHWRNLRSLSWSTAKT